jgi:hypothetical protein
MIPPPTIVTSGMAGSLAVVPLVRMGGGDVPEWPKGAAC